MASCPECGFDGSQVSPSDAAVALRSLPRRYRAVATRLTEDDDPGPVLVELAAAARRIDDDGRALRQVLVSDDPALSPPPSGTGDVAREVSAALDRLAEITTSVAEVVEGVDGDDWRRTGHRPDGSTVSALDLARAAVHAGVHHLRRSERAVSR